LITKIYKIAILFIVLFSFSVNLYASESVQEKVLSDLKDIKEGALVLSADINNDYYEPVIKILQSMMLELANEDQSPFATQYDFSFGVFDGKMKSLVSRFQLKFMKVDKQAWYSGILGKNTYQNLLRELRKQSKATDPNSYVRKIFPVVVSTKTSDIVPVPSNVEALTTTMNAVSGNASSSLLNMDSVKEEGSVAADEIAAKSTKPETSSFGDPEVDDLWGDDLPVITKKAQENKSKEAIPKVIVEKPTKYKDEVLSLSKSGYIDQKYSGLLYSKSADRLIQTAQDEVDPQSEMFVALGESKIFDSKLPIKKIALGDNKIADTLIVNSKQILVNAKSLGITTMTIWDNVGNKELYYISVGKQSQVIQTRVFKLRHLKLRGLESGTTITKKENNLESLKIILKSVLPESNFSIFIDQNVILVQGSTSEINTVAKLIRKIDSPIEQIFITAKVAEVDKDNNFDFNNVAEGSVSKVTGGFDKTTGGTISYSMGAAYNAAFAQRLSALSTNGKAKILASPRVIVQSGEIAKMTVGESIPFITWKDGESSISYMEAGVLLSVFAQSNYDGTLTAHIDAEVSNLTADLYQGYPSIQKRSASTTMTLKNNDTIVLAGLVQESKSEIDAKLPIIGDIPLLGDIFSTKTSKSKEVELIISITLHTIRK